jgi:hypothetical protein
LLVASEQREHLGGRTIRDFLLRFRYFITGSYQHRLIAKVYNYSIRTDLIKHEKEKLMKPNRRVIWFSTVSIILVLFGVLYAFFGLGILPVHKDILLRWESALYGAIMMGWGTTLFFAGRLAFKKNDLDLMKTLLYGITVWLVVEALFSAYLGVWFNVGVDIVVLALFSIPLITSIRKL